MIFKSFIPDEHFTNIFDINYENRKHTIRNIIFDFDNTLMPWGSDYISEEVNQLFHRLLKNGYIIIIGTNSNSRRIDKVENKLNNKIKIIKYLKKPLKKKILKYFNNNCIDPSQTLFIGDNLITDIKLGNDIGCKTIKVDPLSTKEYWGTKIYRVIEGIIYSFNYKHFKRL